MVDPTPSDYHLTYLRERWERDRSSRVFLQLAEEYRRRGLHADAIEVLETGLSHHPGYLAAQVSLGRCRLEAGDPRGAVAVFERVLQHDPTQAVASRLLVEAWLQLGEEEPARAALDRCRLIGVQPADLAGLSDRLGKLRERPPAARPPEPAPAPSEPEAAPVEESRPLVAEPVIAASAPATEPLARLAAGSSTPSPAVAASAPGGAEVAPRATESAATAGTIFRLPPPAGNAIVLPMRPRADHRPARAGGSSAAIFHLPTPRGGSGTIFHLPAPAPAPAERESPVAAAPAAVQPPAVAAITTPPAVATAAPVEAAIEPTATIEPAFTAPLVGTPEPADVAASDPWWRLPGAAPLSEPASEPETAARPEPVEPAPEPLEPEPQREPEPLAEEPEPAAVAAAPVPVAPAPELVEPATSRPTITPAPAAPAAPAAAAGVQVQPAGTVAPAELRPSEPGTATLGELYLRQGYVREAEQIFRQVLERDAENEAALRGLESIGRQRAAQLTAADLVASNEAPTGLTARKMHLLKRYLRTIRRGAGA